jgi:hypothetical protein
MVELALKVVRYLPNFRLAKVALFLILVFLALNPITRAWVMQSSSDAFISVTSFVAATIYIFYYFEVKKYNLQSFITKNKKFEILIASFLGVIPGCGGAIMVMTLYVRGVVSFSSVIATLVSTMGDAAFLLIASNPKAALIILPVTFVTGIVSGYTALLFEDKISPTLSSSHKEIKFEEFPENKIPTFFYKSWLWLIPPAIILGLINALGKSTSLVLFNIDWVLVFSCCGALFCFLMWLCNPLSDIQMAVTSHKEKSSKKVVDMTCFITVWVIVAFVSFEIINGFTGGQIFEKLKILGPFIPLIAIIIGFIPGCGPQIMITTMYLGGHIPIAAQIGNSISNDGDALFPALAIAPKAAILATLYSAIPAVLVAYAWYYFI